jgi:hypothetical protein
MTISNHTRVITKFLEEIHKANEGLPPEYEEVNIRFLDPHCVREDDPTFICTTDSPGPGGAYHEYIIHLNNGSEPIELDFQKGGIPEFGVNGVTHEMLLAIVIDRLRCFQEGPYPCEENQRALKAASEALGWLQVRTLRRIERGVEGEQKA